MDPVRGAILWCEAAWVTPVGVASVASSAFDLNPGCSWLDDPSNVAFAAPVSAAEAIYGTARLTEGGAVPLLQRLAPIYLGPGRSIRQPHAEHYGLCHQNHAGTLHWDWSVGSTSHWLTMSHH